MTYPGDMQVSDPLLISRVMPTASESWQCLYVRLNGLQGCTEHMEEKWADLRAQPARA